jgi:hypothetical protein
VGLGAVVLLVLTACNPLPNQPTHVKTGTTVTSSWEVEYTGADRAWLEVAVTQAPVSDVAVRAYIRDPAHWATWYPLCIYSTGNVPAWVGGQSNGYQRLGELWGPARFYVEADATGGPITFDVRVVTGDGTPTGDLVHHVLPATDPPAPPFTC